MPEEREMPDVEGLPPSAAAVATPVEEELKIVVVEELLNSLVPKTKSKISFRENASP